MSKIIPIGNKLLPGSPEAKKKGCQCPISNITLANQEYPGQFILAVDCTLHGIWSKPWRSKLPTGEMGKATRTELERKFRILFYGRG